MNYYNEIKSTLIKNEANKRVKDYSKNKYELQSYLEVGRLLVEAQGGEERAKYGNKLIKEYSERLTNELGKGYGISTLKDMRNFYLFQKSHAVHGLSEKISWNHYKLLFKLKSSEEIQYYIYIAETQNLGYRDLQKRIKSNEYQRIGYKEELEEPKVNTLIKNPIIINAPNDNAEEISEKMLHGFILEDIDNVLKELGVGFTYVGHEVKIKIGNNYHYIDFLLYNYKFNLFVVLEIKVTKMKPEYIGQVMKYINYVDKYIKDIKQDKTIGIVICKKEDKYVMEFCSDDRIFTTTYELQNKQKKEMEVML